MRTPWHEGVGGVGCVVGFSRWLGLMSRRELHENGWNYTRAICIHSVPGQAFGFDRGQAFDSVGGGAVSAGEVALGGDRGHGRREDPG